MEPKSVMEHFHDSLTPAAPPSAVSALMVIGVPLDQWVLILNAIYIVGGIAWLGYKFYRAFKDKDKQ